MNRRSALKHFAFISAGAVFLPSCLADRSKASILLKNIYIDGGQEELLAELSEMIIPATETPGAKDVSAHLFSLKMIDDCYSEDEQKKFINGLKQFEKRAGKLPGGSFIKTTPSKREELLKELENNREAKEDIKFFYSTIKRMTIRGYTSSQYFLTEVKVHEMIPGRWIGCTEV